MIWGYFALLVFAMCCMFCIIYLAVHLRLRYWKRRLDQTQAALGAQLARETECWLSEQYRR